RYHRGGVTTLLWSLAGESPDDRRWRRRVGGWLGHLSQYTTAHDSRAVEGFNRATTSIKCQTSNGKHASHLRGYQHWNHIEGCRASEWPPISADGVRLRLFRNRDVVARRPPRNDRRSCLRNQGQTFARLAEIAKPGAAGSRPGDGRRPRFQVFRREHAASEPASVRSSPDLSLDYAARPNSTGTDSGGEQGAPYPDCLPDVSDASLLEVRSILLVVAADVIEHVAVGHQLERCLDVERPR